MKAKIGVLIPTRGDRPQFLQQALSMLSRQLLEIDYLEIVDDQPKSNEKDITWRYRIGCERLVKKGADLIFFWEDDDYYKEQYLLSMYDAWMDNGKPQIIGINNTIYYHLRINKWLQQFHPNRASAFCTAVTKDIVRLKWCSDKEPFTDIFLWKKLRGISLTMPTMAIGIKHSIGLCGGNGHCKHEWYKHEDYNREWLSSHVDKQSLEFYNSI